MATVRSHHHRRRTFRLPFFRIFYSVTYTVLYLLVLVLLAITPISIIYGAFEAKALQYAFMVGGTCVLTLILAVLLYSTRIYTNRAVLAAVGKPYIPIEDGEVSTKVRRMIVKQLERSAMISWESRPRDLEGEVLAAQKEGILPLQPARSSLSFHNHGRSSGKQHQHHQQPQQQSRAVDPDEWTVGSFVPVDPACPPWGRISHPGWSSPSSRADNPNPHVSFTRVIAELPHLIEARAVSLAPSAAEPDADPDPRVVALLRRPPTAALREYITQLSCLTIFPPEARAEDFLRLYERARFSGTPTPEPDFNRLMRAFADLLAGMRAPPDVIVAEILRQTAVVPDDKDDLIDLLDDDDAADSSADQEVSLYRTPSPISTRSPVSTMLTPVTAREVRSRAVTPYLQQDPAAAASTANDGGISSGSNETLGSVIIKHRHRRPVSSTFLRSADDEEDPFVVGGSSLGIPGLLSSSPTATAANPYVGRAPSLAESELSLPSDAGSVVRRPVRGEFG